ncbi:hypothetical protein [Aliivibrio fischeri]|uniref:hypothetical protein n=1 Tax=Aliivibrio fischeri TaxID=668 RepID=UPI00080E995E|nr:hypothetical protein [Aliivibrio fischeri]OCH45172.1 hypothetical protein A6E02_11045 [Aliivibrio fischeri]
MSKTKKQKLLYSIMVVAMMGMVGNMTYSYLSSSKKATQRALAEQRQAWKLKQTALAEPAPPSLIKGADKSWEKPQKTPSQQTVSTTSPNEPLPLSENAKASLTALKNTYLSDLKTTEHNAKIAEIEANQHLNALQHPAPVKKKEVVSTPKQPTYTPPQTTISAPLLEQVKVKSIFFNDTRVVAWLDLNGQLVPVKKGAHIWGAMVTDITKNSVIFNDNGHKVTRYKMPPQPKKKDTDNKADKDMT